MDEFKSKLFSKNGLAITSLAKEFLMISVGDRISTVQQFAENLELGRGTIQLALKFLKSTDAIRLEPRGHLGTFVTSINYEKLWEISGIGAIIGVMPLPYTKRYEGLATGLYKAFETAHIPFSLAFMRGATKRVEALIQGRYNFAILSKLAATLEIRKPRDIEIAYEFPECSYVGNHVIILKDARESRIRSGMRVGIDPVSIDQYLLTCNECEGLDVEYVEISYTQFLQRIKNGEIDAAVWSGDELEMHSMDYQIVPLNNVKARQIGRDDTTAVVVVNKGNSFLSAVIDKLVDMQGVSILQEKVQKEEIIPTY